MRRITASQELALRHCFSPTFLRSVAKNGKAPLFYHLIERCGWPIHVMRQQAPTVGDALNAVYRRIEVENVRCRYRLFVKLFLTELGDTEGACELGIVAPLLADRLEADIVVYDGKRSSAYVIPFDEETPEDYAARIEALGHMCDRVWAVFWLEDNPVYTPLLPDWAGLFLYTEDSRLARVREPVEDFLRLDLQSVLQPVRTDESRVMMADLGLELLPGSRGQLRDNILALERVRLTTLYPILMRRMAELRRPEALHSASVMLPRCLVPAVLFLGLNGLETLRVASACRVLLSRADTW